MAWQTLSFHLTSDCRMLMHAATTCDPLHPITKAMKQVSGKRAKTDADYEEMARLEYLAALYMNADGPVIPAENIDAVLIAGAKKSKEGVTAKSGMFCPAPAPLLYDGPRTVDGLWADRDFRLVARVRVGTASVMRTRPMFETWQADVLVNFEPTLVNPARIDEWFRAAGQQVGLGDWRPQNGRFSVARNS